MNSKRSLDVRLTRGHQGTASVAGEIRGMSRSNRSALDLFSATNIRLTMFLRTTAVDIAPLTEDQNDGGLKLHAMTPVGARHKGTHYIAANLSRTTPSTL